MIMDRRRFITGTVSLLAAPMIIPSDGLARLVPHVTPDLSPRRVESDWWPWVESDHIDDAVRYRLLYGQATTQFDERTLTWKTIPPRQLLRRLKPKFLKAEHYAEYGFSE